MITIQNSTFAADINALGAELSSLRSAANGQEYLWQGNPAVWAGRSPLLFPVIGRLLDDKYRVKGREYSLPKHGFARTSVFSVSRVTPDSAVFTLADSPSTRACYPFSFRFDVCFQLTAEGIRVTHTVENRDDEDMFFSVGAHPGFNCELGDVLVFEQAETLRTERIDENALLTGQTYPLLDIADTVTITPDLFVNDALFLSGYRSRHVMLRCRRGYAIDFDFEDAPFLGIWAKPAAPYVCIEPWYGINDGYEKKEDISQKRGILRLAPAKSFSFSWSARITP